MIQAAVDVLGWIVLCIGVLMVPVTAFIAIGVWRVVIRDWLRTRRTR